MKILFICTHNRCRSILAEAVTNHRGQGRIHARSAGSAPVGAVHPLSLSYLQEAHIPTAGLRSQSWDDHEDWQPDVVITVCDRAAGESCPLWFGQAVRAHWGLADPSAMEGDEDDIASAFRHTIDVLGDRVDALLAADADTLDEAALTALLRQLGES